MSEHNHNHHHHDHSSTNQSKLGITILLNLVITIAEFIGGFFSGSLALVSDAFHNLGDVLSIILSYIGARFSTRDNNLKKTFGYKRIEILIALFNSLSLIFISAFLIYEAFERFNDLKTINGSLMTIIAIIGLLGNGISVLVLHKNSKDSLNLKSAYLHLFSDTLSSVAVILSGFVIMLWDVRILDPIITIAISLYIIFEAYQIIKETIDILMQAVPNNIDLEQIKLEIEKIENIKNIHHIHVWRLNDKDIHFEGHVELSRDLHIKETEVILAEIKKNLHQKFDITHVTLQFECGCCKSHQMIHNND